MSAESQSEIDILKSVLRSDEEQLRIERDKTMGAVKTAMDYLAECDVLRELLRVNNQQLEQVRALLAQAQSILN